MKCVIGTTGFSETEKKLIEQYAASTAIVMAPNMGVGVNVMLKLLSMAAKALSTGYDIEVIEAHHRHKIDAPSGTAARTAELMSAARKEAGLGAMPDATSTALDGARGALVGDIPVHSVRARGLVAHQEVLFGGLGETLTIRHDSIDRAGFMPGVILGVRKIVNTPGLTHGLDKFM
mgnify:CR=1 FL=1